MTRFAFAFACALALVPAVAAAENHLMDDKKTVTYDCAKDAQTNIMGNDNVVTLVGACETINISGNHNTITGPHGTALNISGNDNAVTVDVLETVNLSGNHNTVHWKKSSPKDKGPAVNTVGKGNSVSAAK